MAYIFGSIWDRFNRNALNNLSKNVETQGKSIQDLVAEGQLTPSQYAELVRIVNGNAKKSEVRLNTTINPINVREMDTETKQLFTGGAVAVVGENAVGNENLKSGAVNPIKTTFAKAGKNKFDGNFLNGISIINGVLTDRGEGYASAIIELERDKEYAIQRGPGGSPITVGVHEGHPAVGDTLTRMITPYNSSRATFTLSGNETHVVIYVKNLSASTLPEWMQVEEGEYVEGGHTPYSVHFDFEDGSISTKSLRDVQSRAILTGQSRRFNVDIDNNKITTISGGFILIGDKSYNLTNGDWDFSHITTQTVVVLFNKDNSSIEFSEPLPSVPEKPIIGIVRKDEKSADIQGNYTFNGSNVLPFTEADKTTGGTSKTNVVVSDFAGKPFKSESEFVYVENTSDIQVNEVYDMYDDLVTDFPDYVSRKHLGDEVGGLPIYQYEFKPPKPVGANDANQIKIIHVGTTHGHEKKATIASALFFKEMCEKWKTEDVLRVLRWNVHFVVIPILNPAGFNANTRVNRNGVDLNRNYRDGWSYISNDNEWNYSGEEPLSELESQYLVNVMDEHPDAHFAIDHHNFDYLSSAGYGFWYASNFNRVKMVLNGLAQQNTSMLYNYGFISDENESLGRVISAHGGGTIRQFEAKGIPATLFETAKVFGGTDEEDQLITIDGIGNLFYTVVRYINEISAT